jgi:hypothetical protein
MLDDLNGAIDEYISKWQSLIAQRKNKEFFERLRPTAVGWKVTDMAEHDRLVDEWRSACDQIVAVWLNDRWITKMHLKDRKLSGGIEIIKVMQRRPGSDDAIGLDHLDFLDMEETNTIAILAEENLKTSNEENGISHWTSIWFDGTEAKLRQGTVLDTIIAELRETNEKILGEKFAAGQSVVERPHVSEVE